MVFFAHDVTSGNNYEGKIVKLETSLDFNSVKSYVDPFRTDYSQYGYDGELKSLLTSGEGFKSIGIPTDSTTQNFYGTFKGNGNSIINLYINIINQEATSIKAGLFSNNHGNIYDLKLLNVNLYLKTNSGSLGAISGQNSKTGNINNCIVTGNIKNESIKGSVGGITCYCSGNISNCANMANIIGDLEEYNVDGGEDIGGICANTGNEAQVKNCCNTGNITGTKENGILYIGGITGNDKNNAIIQNCYNSGKITGKAIILRIGGIIGYQFGTIENCYDIGNIEGTAIDELNIGRIVGKIFNNDSIVSNSYYLQNNANIKGIGSREDLENMLKTEKEMKDISFIEQLNQSTNSWKEDKNNINNGYPILKWQ